MGLRLKDYTSHKAPGHSSASGLLAMLQGLSTGSSSVAVSLTQLRCPAVWSQCPRLDAYGVTLWAVPSLVGSADLPRSVQRPRLPETQEKCNRERSAQMLDLWHPHVDVTLQSLKGGTHAIWTPPQILSLGSAAPGPVVQGRT